MRKLYVAAGTLLLLACHEPTQPDSARPSATTASTESKRWVIVFNQPNGLPNTVERIVANAGGVITARLPEIGAIGARSSDPAFAAKIAAEPQVKAVSEDVQVQMIPAGGSHEVGAVNTHETPGPAEPAGPDPQPGTEPLYNQQWDKMRMNASATGSYAVQRGRRDVVVAILDTGVEFLPVPHPDIAPNLDAARSRSFVVPEGTGPAGGDPNPAAWDDRHGHGSWCASAVAAPINAFGISGVAPNVTVVALKVLDDAGSGSYLWVAQALVYAGVNQFDVASMSLGGFLRHADHGQALVTIVQRAVEFARSQGVLPIASLGNDNLDVSDGYLFGDFIVAPVELPGVVGVSATGYTNRKAFYSNYGVGKTDVSAPGGGSTTFDPMPPTYAGNGRVLGAWASEGIGAITAPNRIDQCTPGPGGACFWYAWVRGTSMAAPNAAGVAALIFSQYGIDIPPTRVESILQQTANNQPCVDNDSPTYISLELAAYCKGEAGGYTNFFGKGIVDALKAVTQ
jgi:subtilisin family serine protease